MTSRYLTVQNLAWLFVAMFFVLVAMNYTPFIYAENGKVFGFFKLEPEGNILHVLSAIWAAGAAWTSRKACLIYFRVFGTAYFLDGVVGVIFGKAYLNLNLFHIYEPGVADMFTRLVLNTPHLVIGGTAMLIGFYFYKRLG